MIAMHPNWSSIPTVCHMAIFRYVLPSDVLQMAQLGYAEPFAVLGGHSKGTTSHAELAPQRAQLESCEYSG